MTNEQAESYPVGKTTQQNGESIIGSYLLDLLKAGLRADLELDMTYESVKLLPRVMHSCLQGLLDDGLTFQQSVDAAARSLAAYLFALGMNEHDKKLTVTMKRSAIMKPDPDEGPLWAECMRITIGSRRQKDFLIPALKGSSGVYREGKSLMLMAVGPLIRAYKSAFNVDLSKYDFVDMVLEVDTKE